jgi:hypothetical protein
VSAAPTATSPSGSRAATADEVQLIRDVTTGAQDYTSYHFQIQIKPSTYITRPVNAEGDYESPNMVYMKGTMGDQNFEEVVVNDTVFQKDASGNYVKQEPVDTSSDPLSSFSPESIVSGGNPLGSLGDLTTSIKNFQYAGDVTIDGVSTKHFIFSLDVADLMEGQDTGGVDMSDLNLGTGGLYIDANKKLLYGIDYDFDLAAIFELMSRAFSAFGGTPTPGGVAATPIPKLELNLEGRFTKHNDPSIKVPATDEMKQEAGVGTSLPPTDVPSGDSTPATDATAMPEATTGTGSTGGVTAQVGEPTTIGWATFTVNSVRRENSGNLDPGAGNEYVIVNVSIKNDGSAAGESISSLLMMELVDATGKSMDWAFGAKANPLLDTEFQDNFKGQPLAQGDTITGEVGYEVPQGATGLVLHFKPNPLLDEATMVSINIDQ